MSAIQTKPGPQDLYRQMGPEMYRQAYKRGMSLSSYLEQVDPSSQYKDGLDAFSRVMQAAGIKTNSLPHLGVWSDTFDKFMDTEQDRALLVEWVARRWRESAYGRSVSTNPVTNRATYQSTDEVVGSFNNPYFDAAPRQDFQIAPAIPLSELIAVTTPIDGDTYRMTYINVGAAADRRLVRVGERGEIPTVKLQTSDKTVDLFKFGRALESSYESLRRMRIDKVARHIALMAVQAESDKLVAVMDVLVNGDGSAGSGAATFDLTDLDSTATPPTPTLKAWLAFKMKFANPYMLTTVLAQEGPALNLLLLNTGSGNVPLVTIQGISGFGSFSQINRGLADGVGLGWTSDAPATTLVGFDRRFAVERVVEIGANISETERVIRQQIEVITFTEVEGYAKMDHSSVKLLDLSA